ncbi:MAG: adenosine deaminase [Ignavibacteriales bacterium]|nr:adenosine deaminase [Ignavibacteriales bacterium]
MHDLQELEHFINSLPKAELHLHIEGSLEPELMFTLAQRNNVNIRFDSVEELKNAYNFNNLQEFLNLYYEGANVLLHEQDFYELTMAYMERINRQNVLHTEIFFDPQTHTIRGVPFSDIITGIRRALQDAENQFGITSKIIMCFLRDMSAESAMQTLIEAKPHKEWIVGVGLDSAESGNPPEKFTEVFEQAITEGYLTVAHAGEEGPADYVREALQKLKVSRIDHGNRALEDEALVQELASLQVPLTVCPLSNLKLCGVTDMTKHPLKIMLQKGLLATVNSDDPAYFGGYMTENFLAVATALDLSRDEIVQLAKNSFLASFLSAEEKAKRISSFEL